MTTKKTCDEYEILLEEAVSDDLARTELDRVMDHLDDCPSCHSYWRSLQQDNSLLAAFSESLQSTVSRIEDNVIAGLPSHQETEPQRDLFWRWIVFSNWGRIAAFTSFILLAILAYSLFDQPGSTFTAWAEVVVNIENADTVRFWERDLVSGHEKLTIVSGDRYYREVHKNDRLFWREYWDEATDSIIFFDDDEKKYGHLLLSPNQTAEAQELAPQNLLARVLKFEHRDLGEDVVDGRRAVGIAVNDPGFEIAKWDRTEAELWVDIDTRLPIRFEMIGEANQGKVRRHLVLEQFEWNVEVTSAELTPGVPPDYELIMSLPEIVGDEEHAIEGLRIYADLTRGRFPSTLSMETALQEAKSSFRPGNSRLRDIEDAWNIYSAGKFYEKLMRDGRNPVYLGNQVRLGDQRVLLRWTVGVDRYRAIMGDLSVEDFNGKELLQAEH